MNSLTSPRQPWSLPSRLFRSLLLIACALSLTVSGLAQTATVGHSCALFYNLLPGDTTNLYCPPTFIQATSLNLPGPGQYSGQILGTFTHLANSSSPALLQAVVFGDTSAYKVLNPVLSTTGPDGAVTTDGTTLYAYGDISFLARSVRPSVVLLTIAADQGPFLTAFQPIGTGLAKGSSAGCATDVTAKLQITVGKAFQLFGSQLWTQVVTLQNTSGTAIAGPVQLATTSLSTNARVFGATGTGTCPGIAGSPFQNVNQNGIPANALVKVVLTFTNSQIPSSAISFTPLIVSGGSTL